MVNMDWMTLITVSVGSGFIGALIKTWLDHWLNVKRSRIFEERQVLQKRREASAAIADILAEWTRSAYTHRVSDEDLWRLQTTYWKNILWLDKELLTILLPALALKPGAAKTNEIIVQTRKTLLGLAEPDITASELNNWLPRQSESTLASKNASQTTLPARAD